MIPQVSDLRQLVLDCLRQVLAERGVDADGVDEATPLVGRDAVLDSLGLVTLIVDVEDRLASEHDVEVTLADERAMSATKSPFRNVAALADHVAAVLSTSIDD